MRTTSPEGIAFIKHWEGEILFAYDDKTEQKVDPGDPCQGTITIGIGHTSAAGKPEVYPGMRIDAKQSFDILINDLRPVEHHVNTLVTVPLSQAQFNALVSFHFDTGWLTHKHCSLLASLNNRQYQLAAEDFMLYDTQAGQIIKGLTHRRAAERALFNQDFIIMPQPTNQTLQSVEEVLKLFEALAPAFAAIPGAAPIVPIITAILPIAVKAVDTIATGGQSQAAATNTVVNHIAKIA